MPSPPKPLNVPRRPVMVSRSGRLSQDRIPLRRRTEPPTGPRMRPLPDLTPPKSAPPLADTSFRPLPRVPRDVGGPTASSTSASSSSTPSLLAPYPFPLRTRSTPELRSSLDRGQYGFNSDSDGDDMQTTTEGETETDTEDDSDAPDTPPDEIPVLTRVEAAPKLVLPLESTARHDHHKQLPPSLVPPRPPSMTARRKRESARRRFMIAVREAARVVDDEDNYVEPGSPRRNRDSTHRRAIAAAAAGDGKSSPSGQRTRIPPSVRYSRKWIREKGASRKIVREGEESYADILKALRAL
ncbi:hypothetical protein FB45DRAFT_935152 [Roridomyces roridus]|uniref:Uncharacterized protein n=1 Tax=Roridomyces roridus TaxID=1738132 RepID=A0AAD7BBU0_9AGAR|nr:hypothetical protein FB45DRAFT_935152 [Roridomyces roridus]